MFNESFATLYSQIRDHEGQPDLYRTVLLPWHATATTIMDVLTVYGSADAMTWRLWTSDTHSSDQLTVALWELYALSRVSDMLLLPFQPAAEAASDQAIPAITADERQRYLCSLGMTPILSQPCCPFFMKWLRLSTRPTTMRRSPFLRNTGQGFCWGTCYYVGPGSASAVGGSIFGKKLRSTPRCTGPLSAQHARWKTSPMAGGIIRNGARVFGATMSMPRSCPITSTAPITLMGRRLMTRPSWGSMPRGTTTDVGA
jgi:hypothetical protein